MKQTTSGDEIRRWFNSASLTRSRGPDNELHQESYENTWDERQSRRFKEYTYSFGTEVRFRLILVKPLTG